MEIPQHLSNLLENYLEPLKKETFLSASEINALFGNINEIYAFQRLFQSSLEDAVAVEPNLDALDQPSQFKVIGNFCIRATDGKNRRLIGPSKKSSGERGDPLILIQVYLGWWRLRFYLEQIKTAARGWPQGDGRRGVAAGGWPQGGGRRGMASRDRVLIGWDLIDCGIV